MSQREAFVNAMAAFAGGVTIITTGKGEERGGLTATAVCSLSADPPSLIVCINKKASAHDLLVSEKCFAVNVLSPKHRDVALKFANSSASGYDKFVAGEWGTLHTGVPTLKTASAIFDCELEKVVDGFSHTILIGLVKHTFIKENLDDGALVWHGRRFRSVVDILVETETSAEGPGPVVTKKAS